MTRLTYNTTYPGPRTSYMIAFRLQKIISEHKFVSKTYSGTHITSHRISGQLKEHRKRV